MLFWESGHRCETEDRGLLPGKRLLMFLRSSAVLCNFFFSKDTPKRWNSGCGIVGERQAIEEMHQKDFRSDEQKEADKDCEGLDVCCTSRGCVGRSF